MLDSTGTPTQYVQDTIPDTGKTIPDPKDATKQIQDPNATLPKIDSDDNMIPVYVCRGCQRQSRERAGWKSDRHSDRQGRQTSSSVAGGGGQDDSRDRHRQLISAALQKIHRPTLRRLPATITTPKIRRRTLKFGYVIIQACIAILILVGFESVTSMGEEAKNAKRDIPKPSSSRS